MISRIVLHDEMNKFRFRYRPNKFPDGYYYEYMGEKLGGADKSLTLGLLQEVIHDNDRRAETILLFAMHYILTDNKKQIRLIMNSESPLRDVLLRVREFDFYGHINRMRLALVRE